MEAIVQIRQMMAEQKFLEAQKLIEVQLKLNSDSRHELLKLYFESLQNQHKNFAQDLAIELAELEVQDKHFDFALELINLISSEKFFIRILKIKIQTAQDKGQMEELYAHISEFLLRQFEKQVPVVPQWITDLTEKYFKDDFKLKLKRLALSLLLNDVSSAEELTKQLIISTVERSSPKGIESKLLSIGEILKSGHNKAHLEIYQNFCLISANGISEKADYKRLVEMTIFFDQFKFQVLLLDLLQKLNLGSEVETYATVVRENPEYNFVYLDKFFPHLKSLFVQSKKVTEKPKEEIPTPDLQLTEKYKPVIVAFEEEPEHVDDEQRFMSLLKYQTYSTKELCDLSVSFLQSEMPSVALKASEMALAASADDHEILKASYLKLTSQLKLNDFRAAVDTCFVALTKATTRDDILSFMYGQAEAYIRLNQRKQAKAVLFKIVSIDAKYRLAKERLDQLNEI